MAEKLARCCCLIATVPMIPAPSLKLMRRASARSTRAWAYSLWSCGDGTAAGRGVRRFSLGWGSPLVLLEEVERQARGALYTVREDRTLTGITPRRRDGALGKGKQVFESNSTTRRSGRFGGDFNVFHERLVETLGQACSAEESAPHIDPSAVGILQGRFE